MGKPFYTLTVDGEDYKLAFSASATIGVEEKLGCGLMEAMCDGKMMKSISTQVTLLWGALQKYQHGMKYSAAAEIYDDLMVEHRGKGMGILIEAINGALVAAGFIPPAPKPEKKGKKEADTEDKTE